jgi:eukaryotic-like serine/threonine-protein kinase
MHEVSPRIVAAVLSLTLHMNEIDAARWKHLSPLLDTALELDDVARAAWFDTLALTDPTSASDLRELLAQDRTGTGTGTVTQVLRELNGDVPDLTGTTIGNWTITAPLGAGGMGSVWLADRSDGNYQGKAAVKLLNLLSLGVSGLQRFQHEGTALARLTHANIARLLDAGVRPSGQPYLVLEFIDGVRIDRWSDSQRLTIPERLMLFEQVCAAVEHAHSHLVIHRDIKPSNVLVAIDGSVKLLDFGVARLLLGDSSSAISSTAAQPVLPFTPSYAAPEQIAGERESAATDTYSLAVLLHVLLIGELPARPARKPSDVAATQSGERMLARRSTPAAVATALRGDLDAVLVRALDPMPERRYQSVAAFAADLQRVAKYESVSVRDAGWGERARKFVQRNRAVVAATGAVAAALIAGTVVAVRQMREAQVQRDLAEFAAEEARAAGDLQLQMISMIAPGGGQLPPEEVLRKARLSIESRFRDRPALLSSLLSNLSDRYADVNDLDNQRDLLRSAADAAHRAGQPGREASSRCLIGWTYLRQGHPDSAQTPIQQGISLISADAFGVIEAKVACNTARAVQMTQRQQGDSALLLNRQSIRLLEESGDTLSSNYSSALNNFGGTLIGAGRLRNASSVFARTALTMQRIGRADTEGMSVVQGNRIVSLMGTGQFLDARAVLEGERVRVQGSADSVTLPLVLRYRGIQLYSRLHALDSLQRYARSIFADEQAQNPMLQVEGRALLATALFDAGQRGVAQQVYRELESRRAAAPPQPRLQVLIAVADAAFRSDAQGPAYALDSLRAFIDRSRKAKAITDAVLYPAYLRASMLALRAGDAPTARQWAEQARVSAMADTLTLTRSALVGDAIGAQARAFALARDVPSAIRSAQQAIVPLRAGYGVQHPRVQQLERWLADTLLRVP